MHWDYLFYAFALFAERAKLEMTRSAQASELVPTKKYLTASLCALALLILGVFGWLILRKTKRRRWGV